MARDYEKLNKEELLKEIKELKSRKSYGLVWEDKSEDVVERCKKELPIINEVEKFQINKDKDLLDNFIIEGDNYHSLSVLNYTHKGKINGIYIDPPYNTGAKDWKYNNDYIDKEDSYRHTKWISFMKHRLALAKELLALGGIICCTIDDHELPRLLLLMEEIFGENNHLGTICIRNNPSGRSTVKGISITHEYAVFFSKSSNFNIGRLPRSEKQLARYNKKDSKGFYEEVNFRKGGGLKEESPVMFYPVFISNKNWRIPDMEWDEDNKEWLLKESPKKVEEILYPIDDQGREKRWKWSFKRALEQSDDLFVRKIKGKKHLFHKNRMSKDTVLPNTWWDKNKYSATDHGTRLLKEMFGELKTFDYPKAVVAVKDCLRVLSPKKNALFLDFFAGSGTTGHAVIELNKEDGGNRRFILCTNNENKIAEEVTYPRVKKVIEGYADEKGIPANLRYYKTDFVDIESINSIPDEKKINLTYKAGRMIAVKEDTLDEIDKNDWWQIFTDNKNKK
ncbi:MAG: site-specific DNA-methyltransferase, partial [Candidatus Paceibacterota bacterium]